MRRSSRSAIRLQSRATIFHARRVSSALALNALLSASKARFRNNVTRSFISWLPAIRQGAGPPSEGHFGRASDLLAATGRGIARLGGPRLRGACNNAQRFQLMKTFARAVTQEHNTFRRLCLRPFAILARTYIPTAEGQFVIGGNLTIVRKKSARRSTLQNGKRTGGRNHAKPHERYNFFLCCVRYCFYFYFGSDALD